jgi:hypothetical protein
VEAAVSIDGYSTDINTSAELKLYDAEDNEIKNSSITMNISTVNIAITILATKDVPLTFVVPDEPPTGYIIDGDVVSSPETVKIAGRKATLDGITKISVSDPSLSVEEQTSDLTTTINIKKYLPTGTQFADSNFSGNVSVTVGIEPLVTKEIKIPVENFGIGNKPEGFDVTLIETDEDDTYSIKISGTQAAVNSISVNDVIGVIDMDMLAEELEIDEWTKGSYTGKITFNLPDNVKLDQDYTMTLVLEENGDNND